MSEESRKIRVEDLGYYDSLANIGFDSFFYLGGRKSTEELLEIFEIDEDKVILVIGCGSGYSASHIAKTYGSKVVGIDISYEMIQKAKERVKTENLEDKVEIRYGDALNIPFEENSFDIVITEFVSIFLDKKKAFKEYSRVVKPRGFVGINELFKVKNIPTKFSDKIEFTEEIHAKVTGLNFQLPTADDWKSWFETVSLTEITLKEKNIPINAKEMVESIGGVLRFIILLKLMYYILLKGTFRVGLREMGKARRILFRSVYVGYVLCVGKKPNK